MKILKLVPDGWPCTLGECPPGPFIYNGNLGFKTEYTNNGDIEVFCETGEYFWAGTNVAEERNKIIVQPVIAKWEEVEL